MVTAGLPDPRFGPSLMHCYMIGGTVDRLSLCRIHVEFLPNLKPCAFSCCKQFRGGPTSTLFQQCSTVSIMGILHISYNVVVLYF